MYPTRNDLPDNTRKAAIELLQKRLADVVDLATQAKQAHWNVKGPTSSPCTSSSTAWRAKS
jgi:starvation-inducible DNA-binding protein